MNDALPDPDWETLENFYGYGNIKAPVVFIGIEEHAVEDSLESELAKRSDFAGPIHDLYEMQCALGHDMHFRDKRPKCQRTWRPMCHLMIRRSGNVSTNRERNKYQAMKLARKDGDTLIIELFPLPKPKANKLPQIYWHRYGSDLKAYQNNAFEKRKTKILELIQSHKRELVIGYGKQSWNAFKKLLPIDDWESTSNFECGYFDNQACILAHHFCSRSFNPESLLEEFSISALNARRS